MRYRKWIFVAAVAAAAVFCGLTTATEGESKEHTRRKSCLPPPLRRS